MRTENPKIMIRFEKLCVLHSKELESLVEATSYCCTFIQPIWLCLKISRSQNVVSENLIRPTSGLLLNVCKHLDIWFSSFSNQQRNIMSYQWFGLLFSGLDGLWVVSLLLSTVPSCLCDRTEVLNLFWNQLDELLKLPEVEDLPHFKLLKVGKRKGGWWVVAIIGWSHDVFRFEIWRVDMSSCRNANNHCP